MIGDSYPEEVLEYIYENRGDENGVIALSVYDRFGIKIYPQTIGRILMRRFGVPRNRNNITRIDGYDEFFFENWRNMRPSEFTKAFNERFGTDYKEGWMNEVAHGLGVTKRDDMYTDEQKGWLISNSFRFSIKDLTEEFNRTFCSDRSSYSIKRICSSLGIHINDKASSDILRSNSLNDFHRKKGDYIEEGGIREYDGYDYIKTDGEMVLRHRYEFERLNGRKLGDDEVVMFLDGDRHNFSKENLVPVSRFVHLKMSLLAGEVESTQIKEALVTAFTLDDTVRRIKKGVTVPTYVNSMLGKEL